MSLTKSLLSQGRPRTVLCVSSPLKTHHRLMVDMGVHWGEKYPCDKLGKVLANKNVEKANISAYVQGKKVAYLDCGKQYASSQGIKQHHKAKHGTDVPERDEHFICPYCHKEYSIKKSWAEHKPYCLENPNHKGPFYCRVSGCPAADHPFTQMRNLNFPMSNMHSWKERQA